jgi:hypothetical protein
MATALANKRTPPFVAGDLDVTIIGQLPAAQLPLHDQLKPRPLEMEGFHALLGRRRLIEELLKDPPGDPHSAFVLADDDAELDAIALIVPGRIFGKREKHRTPGGRRHAVPLLFYHPGMCRATAEVDELARRLKEFGEVPRMRDDDRF